MSTGPTGAGTVLAGRYRLDDLLADSAGARFWRATDTILARSVAIHAVPSDDPRAAGLLEAARISATVTDPHLLRVLDCDDEDGITWVVNEWGDGFSLDLMLQQGTLPPSRAAWLTREVAEAIAAGHAQGVPHGRLNPEAVLVTHAGAVKLIGYVVDASLEPPRPPDPLYGELDDREADVINLAGILYAALTGRWPGVSRSAVPTAPREPRRPLRPRQVRAGVPRTLDAICERVLHKEASQHAMPIETALEIAAALADYVGDVALSAPMDTAAPDTGSVTVDQEAATVDPDGTQVQLPDPELARAEPDNTQLTAPVRAEQVAPVADPEATQTFRPDAGDRGSLGPLWPPVEPASPPPPFPEHPKRPLFADTERRVPAASRAAQDAARSAARSAAHTGAGTDAHPAGGSEDQGSVWGQSSPHSTGGAHRVPGSALTTTGGVALHYAGQHPSVGHPNGGYPNGGDDSSASGEQGFWPFEQDPEQSNESHTGKEGRGWLRTAVVVGVLLVLVVAVAVAFSRGRKDAGTPSSSGDTSSPSARPQGQMIKLAGIRDFDPFASPPEENPDTAANAIDGDPATSWMTKTYRGSPRLGGLKPGVGLMVDLGSEQSPRSVSVRFKGAPTSFAVYAAPAGLTRAPDALDQLDKVAARADAPERASAQLEGSPRTRFLLVWLTGLPAVSGGYRGEIVDISVRS